METITYSQHSLVRMRQRSVTDEMVDACLEYGERRRSGCATCCRLTDRALRGTPHARQADRLRGLIVVIGTDGHVITTKWCRKARKPGVLRRSSLVGRCQRWSEFDEEHALADSVDALRDLGVPLEWRASDDEKFIDLIDTFEITYDLEAAPVAELEALAA